MSQVTDTDGIEPEYIVQGVVQTEWDQQTVEECVDTCTYCVQAHDSLAESYQGTEYNRPYKEQNCCHDNGNKRCYNGNAALSGEEGQPVRKLCGLKAVVAHCTDNTCQNTDKLCLDLAVG